MRACIPEAAPIARTVIAGVEGHGRDSAIERRLPGRLVVEGPGRDPARGDAHIEERRVVRAPVELGRLAGQTARGVRSR
jgi:hypothetical protein